MALQLGDRASLKGWGKSVNIKFDTQYSGKVPSTWRANRQNGAPVRGEVDTGLVMGPPWYTDCLAT